MQCGRDTSVDSRYERDRRVPPARIETYRAMRRRFLRGEPPTTIEFGMPDLHAAWEALH